MYGSSYKNAVGIITETKAETIFYTIIFRISKLFFRVKPYECWGFGDGSEKCRECDN